MHRRNQGAALAFPVRNLWNSPVRAHSDEFNPAVENLAQELVSGLDAAQPKVAYKPPRGGRFPADVKALAKRFRLHLITPTQLKITRKRAGEGFAYYSASGRHIKDQKLIYRLNHLAVPPAYEDVRFAADPRAHIQAIGRDAAGRLQYRYHPDWEKVREARKSARLHDLIQVLPKIRRSVAQHLSGDEPKKEFALAAVIELVATASIRAGSEEYAKEHGTRGAATLLKSNVKTEDRHITLRFKAKGSKLVEKECEDARLAAAIEKLRELPGKRLFQYRDEAGEVHVVRARDVNVFLREIAGRTISLKDFRTLCASATVLETLARAVPAGAGRARRKQVLEAVRSAAEELKNTPAICRKSYVHDAVVTAFEDGVLERFASTLKSCRSPARKEQFLAQVLATTA
jgi:DNA topoisomerase-1